MLIVSLYLEASFGEQCITFLLSFPPLFQVQWDEPLPVTKPERVSPWEIEPFMPSIPPSLAQPVAMKNKRPRPHIKTTVLGKMSRSLSIC